jgi:signal transduction histidine kinase
VNAVQASRDGGEVVVRIAADDAQRVRVAVVDAGPGVPEAVVARIFEPFFTTKPTGTGLGLSVVKRVADAHRGTIEVATRPGHGSTFALVLPAARASRF